VELRASLGSTMKAMRTVKTLRRACRGKKSIPLFDYLVHSYSDDEDKEDEVCDILDQLD
jgi:hypothetical protein